MFKSLAFQNKYRWVEIEVSQSELDSLSAKAGFSYDWKKTYDDNYDQGPFSSLEEGDWAKIDSYRRNLDSKIAKRKFLGFTVNSTLGIAAGPLLNHKFINNYYRLGFDQPIQKTVRSIFTKTHPYPNVLLVDLSRQLKREDIGTRIVGKSDAENEKLSITNSFGMPSKNVSEWQDDFKRTKPADGQLRVISVVGIPDKENATIQSFAEDYAQCAQLAFEAGAQIVELNFSCPNVKGKEGQVYTNAETAKEVCKAVRAQIGNGNKFTAKLGFYADDAVLAKSIEGITDYADGVAAINTIPLEIVNENGTQAMPGEGRLRSGVCGFAIKTLALETVSKIVSQREKLGRDFAISGVGGITQAQDALDFYEAGADAIQIATGAMWDQLLGLKIKLLLAQK